MGLAKILKKLEQDYFIERAGITLVYLENTAIKFNSKCAVYPSLMQTVEKEYTEAKATVFETRKFLDSTESNSIKEVLKQLLQEKQKLVGKREEEFSKQEEVKKERLSIEILLDLSTGNLYFPIFWRDYYEKQEELAKKLVDDYNVIMNRVAEKVKDYIVIKGSKRILKNKTKKKLRNLAIKISRNLKNIKLRLDILEINDLDHLISAVEYTRTKGPNLTLMETTKELNINVYQLNKLIRDGKLKIEKIGEQTYIPRDSIQEFIKNYQNINGRWTRGLTIKEAANLLGVKPNTIYWYVYKGNVIDRSHTVLQKQKGKRSILLIDEEEILKYKERRGKSKGRIAKIEKLIKKYGNKLNIPLSEFKLPSKARHIFEQLELKTIADLTQKTENELRCYKGYGEFVSNIVRDFVLKPLELNYKQ